MDQKIIKKAIILTILLGILIISLTGCSNSKDDTELLKTKIDSEMNYLDTQLLTMLNSANGINYRNYRVIAEKVKQENIDSSSESGSGSSQGSKGGSSSGESSSESSGSSGGGGDSQSGSSGSSDSNAVNYSMEPNTMLMKDKTPDWVTLKENIETLYNAWSNITLDLYKININNDDILNFSKDLDTATTVIKNEDKKNTLLALTKLYSHLPKYLSAYSNDELKKGILNTKVNVLGAYAIIEDNNTDQLKQFMTGAEQAYLPVVNNVSNNDGNEYNINRAYIYLKELQNSIGNTDTDIFYIKYRNLIQELNAVQASKVNE